MKISDDIRKMINVNTECVACERCGGLRIRNDHPTLKVFCLNCDYFAPRSIEIK